MAKIRFEDIKVGDSVPALEKHMTQEIINKWAAVSGDYNPLHVDLEFAKTTRFGGTIAHGYISLSYLNEMMTRWLGFGWLYGGKLLDVQMKAPVRPGDSLTCKGKVISKEVKDKQNLVECEVFIENQTGAKPVIGRAVGIV